MADRPLRFTPSHHGDRGPPLLLIHGFMDTWRTWELVLSGLERRREVLAVTLPVVATAAGRRGVLLGITCPVRVVWGTRDRLLPWPAAAVRYRRDWLPQADWVVLDDVGHCPQLDVPVLTGRAPQGPRLSRWRNQARPDAAGAVRCTVAAFHLGGSVRA